jgi:hypothetical protein
MKVQLVTFPGCPNASATLDLLRRVLTSAGAEVEIEEVDTTSSETPEPLRGWDSPTILINGVDPEGASPLGSASCRLYRDSGRGVQGIPFEPALRAAIERARAS